MKKERINYPIRVLSTKAISTVVITIVISICVICGFLALQGCNKTDSKDQNYNQEVQEVADYERDEWQQFEDEFSALPEDVQQNRKCYCENVLERITQTLESDSLNPEERHEAMLTKRHIEKELEIMNYYCPLNHKIFN